MSVRCRFGGRCLGGNFSYYIFIAGYFALPYFNRMKHEQECQCFACTHGEEALENWHTKMMQEHGWFAHYVADHTMPTGINFHTHGLVESCGHLDLQIVFPIDSRLAHMLFSDAIKLVKAGLVIEPGKEISGIISNKYKTLFILATENERQVLRMIIPDKDGHLAENELSGMFAMQYAMESVTHLLN